MSLVRNAVGSAVDELSTNFDPKVVHTFAAWRPLLGTQASLTVIRTDSSVTAASYKAIHTIHSLYFL